MYTCQVTICLGRIGLLRLEEWLFFTNEHLQCLIALVKSIPKRLDVKNYLVKLSNNDSLSVAGCYRPPSAPACTLATLSCALAPFTRSELVLLGDLNWDMIKPPDKVLLQFDSLNLHQIISLPSMHDPKHLEKATLLLFYKLSPYVPVWCILQ